ncbi:Acyltransferase calJ [Psilocybe cubensis]|uniref:Beta-lactamase-related domain-containing protein n=2 Tax=Psilocybe cubensis TaxID=181762 RepID=A0A8H7XUY9_PSICU|nr:Acyltransferase calJ [Psilocybe cubensis]KAH9474867.1 Acyltransferase calJ [Psilocybe cubensis]
MPVLKSSGKEALDRVVDKIAAEKNLPGFLFAATTIDEEIYSKATGYNVLDKPESGKIDDESIFWICSQTKMITHLALLQLIDQGKVSYDTPVSDYLPDFANLLIIDDQFADVWTYKPAKNVMLIKHILNFSSGLFYSMKGFKLDEQGGAYAASHDKTDPIGHFLSELKGGLPGIPILFEPGTSFAYGYSSDIVGFVVEKVTGQTLEEYFQQNIFKPLGMKASFYLTPDIKSKLVDLSYRRGDTLEPWSGQTKLIEQDPSKVAVHLGGVGLYASVKDYLGLLPGKASNPIIGKATLDTIFDPALTEAGAQALGFLQGLDSTVTSKGAQWSTALSVHTEDWPGRRKKGSASWWGWAHTMFFIDPTTNVAAVLGIQVIPTLDQNVFKAWAQLEETLYSELQE